MPHDANEDEMGGREEDDGAAAGQKGGEAERDGGSGGSRGNESDGAAAGNESVLPLQFQTYKEAAKKYYLQHTDNNMVGALRHLNQHKHGTPSGN